MVYLDAKSTHQWISMWLWVPPPPPKLLCRESGTSCHLTSLNFFLGNNVQTFKLAACSHGNAIPAYKIACCLWCWVDAEQVSNELLSKY
jgi:hypothetical protein